MEQPVPPIASLTRNPTPPTLETPEQQNADKNPMSELPAPIPTTQPDTEPPPLSSLLPTIAEVPQMPLAAADTVNYVDTVKAQLHDKPEAYEQFLAIMNVFSAKDHASQVAEAHSVAERVAVLFQGCPDLMPQFNAYMTKLRKSSPIERSPPREGSLPTDPLRA
ncbi:hypothetical protein BD410DRAFT_835494 [Rickenella mellea]|uniref:PAH2 domain-containing protein n=1 Tax=Rickenella mellea TaxID=50990 RepID=A0A4Y7QM10_9AGAM|nr:hypothetical protein BD410DRAFT_835494 [Rickenella mellea]